MRLLIQRDGYNGESGDNRQTFPTAISLERIFPAQGCSCSLVALLVFLLTKLDLNSRCVFCKPLPHLVVRPRPLHGAGITMMAHPAFRGVIPKCMSGGV